MWNFKRSSKYISLYINFIFIFNIFIILFFNLREADIQAVFKYIKSKLEIQEDIFKERPILITEPLLNPYSNRVKIAKFLFETLDVSAVFFASQPILSLYACNILKSL